MASRDWEKNLVRKPKYEVGRGVRGRQLPTMTLMSRDLVPGVDAYLEVGWIYEMPEPNPHIFEHRHPDGCKEIVLHIGTDPDNPEDLGGEIEFFVEGQPLVFDTTSGLYVPEGVVHGPLTWKRVTRPHLQMAIILGAGTLAETNPGGSLQKRDYSPAD